jgi:hypothetical protein
MVRDRATAVSAGFARRAARGGGGQGVGGNGGSDGAEAALEPSTPPPLQRTSAPTAGSAPS